jgi:CHAT domain-containing protein
LGRAIASWPADGEHVARLLEPLEDAARSHGFHNLLARSLAMRALVRVYQSRYVESLDLYDEAGRLFADMRDGENLARISTRKVGVLRTFGQPDAAWKEAFQALRAAQAIEAEERHHLLGEAAAATLALGYLRVALRYQDAAVEMLRQELAATSEGRDAVIRGLRTNLAIALQHRGLIHVDLGDEVKAERDLQEALVLGGQVTDETILRTFQARVWEARARAQSITDPAAAIGTFETALKLVPPHEHLTFRADLWFQRAKAWQRLGDGTAAERDLKRGIEELRAEEKRLLLHRLLGQAEAAWTPYFSRFREAYETLIRLLLDREEVQEAFFYAERVRGYEPLDLVLRLPTTKEVFGKLAQSHEPMSLHEIRRRLPAGTWLVEYLMLTDRVVTWVVSSAGVEVLELPLETATLARWVATVQARAESRDAEGLAAVLAEPYSSLIAEPLAAIARRHGPGAIERLVFVPDGLLHGLPFAALYDRDRGRYLVEDYPVAVAPSATLYVISLDRDARLSEAPATASALLIGDPAFDRSSRLAAGLGRLPRAAREVRRIKDLYRPDVEILTEEQATFDRVLALAPKSAVVHFAGHAVVNPAAPFRSLLLFAPSPAHSGAVSAEELLTDLRAHHTRLFVLAACSSSGGHPIGPEGLSPLVRPLFAAGVPAVLGSLWNIGDDTTEELLVEFHRQYTAGKDAAAALRAAQRRLRQRGGGAGSVLAWAPFQVIGHSASPFPERSP